MDWRLIQARLHQLGFNPGPIDGAYGTLTKAAIAAFQRARNIPVRWPGTIAPEGATMLALFADVEVSAPLTPKTSSDIAYPWMAEARRHLGLKEIVGSKHNSTIVGWLKYLGAAWRDDETAWCGTFVAVCVKTTLSDEPIPASWASSRAWEKFGVKLASPAVGAILVFWRGSPNGWQGHVGFYVGEDDQNYFVLGGNQSNSVSIAKVAKSRLTAIRWPSTVSLPTTGRVYGTLAGVVSTNEA